MDLGIHGRKAIVCASSRGLGLACATALALEGVTVIVNGRNRENLIRAAEQIRVSARADVIPIDADVTTTDGQRVLVAACPDADILINNNAGPSPAEFESIDHVDWRNALDANMLAPLSLVRMLLPGMRERRFGRIVTITSAMVTTPRPHMSLSSGSRAGLTAVLKGLSLQVSRDNVTINNLLPERIDTDRQRFMARKTMERRGISYEEARAEQVSSIAARRLGDPREVGAACAFLCSVWASYISGQNLHLDGGSYPALI